MTISKQTALIAFDTIAERVPDELAGQVHDVQDYIEQQAARIRTYERALSGALGIPASAGVCEPVEGFVERPQDLVPAMKEMAARIAEIEAANQRQRHPGEEIMVNAPHGVYTLPLQDSGLATGPRFVVHVPGPEPFDAGAEAARLFQGLGDELNVLACKLWGTAEQHRAGHPATPNNALRQVCQRYIDILKRDIPSLDSEKFEKMPPGRETTPVHTGWMLEQIPTLPPLKAHRWLGFVQGVLVMSGRTTVEVERQATRGLLGNGANQQVTQGNLLPRRAWLHREADGTYTLRDYQDPHCDRCTEVMVAADGEHTVAVAAAKALTQVCHEAARDIGWWSDADPMTSKANPLHFSNKLMLVVSELAEAMEGDRKQLPDDKLPHRAMREVELADAVIRIFDLAGGYGMDLAGAIEEKMTFNAQRADHKPENRAADGGKKY